MVNNDIAPMYRESTRRVFYINIGEVECSERVKQYVEQVRQEMKLHKLNEQP